MFDVSMMVINGMIGVTIGTVAILGCLEIVSKRRVHYSEEID